MLFQKHAIVSALTVLVAGQDVGQDDIPSQCTAICAPVVALSRGCDDTTNDDAAELNCICTAPNANTLIPACEACVTQFEVPEIDDDDNTPNVNDVREVLTRCNFTPTSFYITTTSPILPTTTQTIDPNRTMSTLSGSVIMTATGSFVPTTTVAIATPTGTINAAPAHTAGVAIGLVAFGFALGML